MSSRPAWSAYKVLSQNDDLGWFCLSDRELTKDGGIPATLKRQNDNFVFEEETFIQEKLD